MPDPVLLHNFKGHKKQITDISFKPDDSQFISSSGDKSIMVWNLNQKNSKCYNLIGHTDVVNAVDFAPSGQLFASGSQDRTVRLWVPSIRGGCTELKAHSSAVRTLSFSPSSNKLITGSNDKAIKIWDVQTRRFLSSLVGHNNWIRCVQHSLHNNILASCSDDRTMRIWDLSCGQCIHVLNNFKGSGSNLSIHPNGNSVALAVSSGSVRVYDIRAQKLQQHYVLHDKATSVAWHPTKNYLLTSGSDGTMRIVDVMEGRPMYTLEAHEGSINSVSFSKSGELFASGGSDQFVNVWNCNLRSTVSSSTSSASDTLS